jgi:hypothetical protein
MVCVSVRHLGTELSQTGFVPCNIASLMHGGVLRRNVDITQPPLKRRAIIDRTTVRQARNTRRLREHKWRRAILRSARLLTRRRPYQGASTARPAQSASSAVSQRTSLRACLKQYPTRYLGHRGGRNVIYKCQIHWIRRNIVILTKLRPKKLNRIG